MAPLTPQLAKLPRPEALLDDRGNPALRALPVLT